MAIDWTSRPGWGFGKNAKPIEYGSLVRHFYTTYSPSSNPVVYYGAGSPGFYTLTVNNLSWINTNGGLLRGTNPSSFIGPDGYLPYQGILMTIAWPKAKRRCDFRMTINNTGEQISISQKWYDTDTLEEVSAPSGYGPGWGSMGHAKNAALIAAEDWPGQSVIWYEIPSHGTCYGFTMLNDYFSGGTHYYFLTGTVIDIEEWSNYMNQQNPGLDFSEWETITESPEAGPPSAPGGYGGYGGGSGDITDSDSYEMDAVPTASAAALGFINMYNPSAGGLSDLGAEIFPDFDFDFIVDPTGNSIIDAILNACGAIVDCFNQIPKMFQMFINSRLIDYVQDCHIVPVKPTTGSPAHIKLGFRELDTTADIITNEYVVADLGSVNLTEFYQSFIDYLPFTRAKLYLPFVGFVPLEPEYWQNGSISVKYKFNVYDGSFSAHVIATPDHSKISQMTNTVIGQYTGTAIIHLPLTGLNYSSMVAGLIGGAGAMVTSIAGGNVAAAATAALNTAASSPQVMSSNAYTASSAFLGQRKPFIVIERSVSHFPQKYAHDAGLPSKITTNLEGASGMTHVSEVDLSGIGASSEEKAMIRSLLASGVYF